MKFFFLLLVAIIAVVATGTPGVRLPVASLVTNKAKAAAVMKLRGGGMALGPINAGNMLDVQAGMNLAYGLQLIFAQGLIDKRFFANGLGNAKSHFTANMLGIMLVSQSAIGYLVSREAPGFKPTLGKISVLTNLAFAAYYAYIKFVSNTFEVSDAGMVEGMIVTGVLGLANAAVFM